MSAGDSSCCHDNSRKYARDHRRFIRKYWNALLSFILLISGIAFSAFGAEWFDHDVVRLVWYIAAYLPVAAPVLKDAWEAILRKDIFSEFFLMGIATIGAFYIGEYPEGVAVMLFYSVGESFQDAAVSKAKRNINALLDIRPETANVVLGNGIVVQHPSEVSTGQVVEIKTGERVPLDGVLLSPSAFFNTSALTGESVPRTIHEGEEVLAGMIASDSVVRMRVTKPFGQSALARILELVENAADRKSPAEQYIRRFARIYTPIVVGMALLITMMPWVYSQFVSGFVYDFNDWLYRGLVFLVISCPCALVVSIPLGYFGGIGLASRHGILFKGGNYLDAVTKLNTVVMDKTGTLTQGVFEVRDIVPAPGFGSDELLSVLAAVENQSNHPLARAVVAYAGRGGAFVPQLEVTGVKEIAGLGVEAVVDGKMVLAGNAKLLGSYNVAFPDEIQGIPETIVLVAVEGRYAGYVTVADAFKPDAAKAVEDLRNAGMKNLVMLSGDKQSIVSKLAAYLGIGHAYGDLMPEGKVAYMEKLKEDPSNSIAFVGDGINDAPVLAMSDVGFAMGGLGSDAAIETADVIIQTDQPTKIAAAIKIGRITRRVVVQNVVMALTIKLAVLVLGALGEANLWEAVFADVGVSLLAVLNSVRILYYKPE